MFIARESFVCMRSVQWILMMMAEMDGIWCMYFRCVGLVFTCEYSTYLVRQIVAIVLVLSCTAWTQSTSMCGVASVSRQQSIPFHFICLLFFFNSFSFGFVITRLCTTMINLNGKGNVSSYASVCAPCTITHTKHLPKWKSVCECLAVCRCVVLCCVLYVFILYLLASRNFARKYDLTCINGVLLLLLLCYAFYAAVSDVGGDSRQYMETHGAL